jgi:REP element-mobilizing transposase RayT
MPRKPRIHFPGALYHCLNRGNRRKPLFLSDEDYLFMLDCLQQTVSKFGACLHGYCLMPNHFHLIIQAQQVPLSTLMRSCLTRYAQHFNRQHHLTGHVFQGRYRAILCQKESYLLELIRYVHLNPVRAHLVEAPHLWRWSSLNDYLHSSQHSWLHTEDVLSHFGRQPRSKLRTFLAQAPDLVPKQIYSPEKFPVLGDKAFIKTVTQTVSLRRQAPRSFPGPRLSLQEIAHRICGWESSLPSILDHRHKGTRRLTQLRKDIIFAASHFFFYPASQIAGFLQISPTAVTQLQKQNENLTKNKEYEVNLYQILT